VRKRESALIAKMKELLCVYHIYIYRERERERERE